MSAAHVKDMTNYEESVTRPGRTGTTAHGDAAETVRAVAARLRAIEKEAALLSEEVLHLQTSVAAQASVPVRAYTYDQVGEAVGLKKGTVSGMVRRGVLRGVKVNGSPRVLPADLDAYLASLGE